MKAIGIVLLSVALAGSLCGCAGVKGKALAERDAYAATQWASDYAWMNNYGR
jgi:hypothetical protein